MFIGIAMFFVLMLMGGLIAFLGDKIGSKVGKKRMTLFGLRPKYTSIIVTIISGVLISFLTVAVLAVVNENVRVALFGLSKLQAQMANLNQEIIVKNKELDEGKKQLEARNKEYEGVTKKSEKTVKELERVESQRAYVQSELFSVQNAYQEAQAGIRQSAEEIEQLEKTKEELSGNITKLNSEKEALLGNIAAIRAGQLLTDAVVDENMSKEQSEQVLGSILNDINNLLKERMNVSDKDVYLVRMPKIAFDKAVDQVAGASNKKLVRVVAAGNLILGEPAIVEFDVHDNNLVFHANETIMTAKMLNYKGLKRPDAQVLSMLNELNHLAKDKGILPDPITGKVGQLEGQELLSVIEKVKGYNSKCVLVIKAKKDIYSDGPLLIDIEVERDIS